MGMVTEWSGVPFSDESRGDRLESSLCVSTPGRHWGTQTVAAISGFSPTGRSGCARQLHHHLARAGLARHQAGVAGAQGVPDRVDWPKRSRSTGVASGRPAVVEPTGQVPSYLMMRVYSDFAARRKRWSFSSAWSKITSIRSALARSLAEAHCDARKVIARTLDLVV
jgi:hypothetical protein